MEIPDEELARRMGAGDRAAFHQVLERWDEAVLALAYRATGDRAAAEDVRQGAFLRAWTGAGSFRGAARFSTWLFRIVLNLAHDRMRERGAEARVIDTVSQGGAAANGAPRGSFANGSARSVSAEEETARRVAAAVASLPRHERDVVVLRHYHELRFAEVAEILSIPESTAKSRMARGLELLRARLEDVMA